MHRKTTTEKFTDVVTKLRNMYDDVILTADIIVGFPNESDEDFEETYNFLRKINFYKMHVFKYSARKGTVAATMKNQIQASIKELRSKKLLQLSAENEMNFLKSYIGKEIDVLFEEREGKFLKGHTGNYIMVKCECDDENINKIVKVKINDLGKECLIAEIKLIKK